MDENKKRIGYVPELNYTDDYYSEIEYSEIDNNAPDEKDEGKEVIDNLINNMNVLNTLISKLPNEASNTIKEVFDPVLDFINEELKDKVVEPIPDEDDWNYADTDNNEDSDNENDDNNNNEDVDDMWGTDDFFPTKEEEYTKKDIYEKEYIKNLVDLFYYYNIELQNIITEFWRDYILATSNKTDSEIGLIINNILFNSNDIIDNAKHLLDSAVRQQIIKDMKLDYHKLMFNLESTIINLKQLKATQEFRIRYANIEKTDGGTKSNQYNNNVLTASLISYDKKYDIAYENLYRYLNSSNKVIKDSFQSWVQEIKSKQTLIEREGIKHESTTNGR